MYRTTFFCQTPSLDFLLFFRFSYDIQAHLRTRTQRRFIKRVSKQVGSYTTHTCAHWAHAAGAEQCMRVCIFFDLSFFFLERTRHGRPRRMRRNTNGSFLHDGSLLRPLRLGTQAHGCFTTWPLPVGQTMRWTFWKSAWEKRMSAQARPESSACLSFLMARKLCAHAHISLFLSMPCVCVCVFIH